MTQKKRVEIAKRLVAQRDEYDRRGDTTLRWQTDEELRALLPRSMWAWAGIEGAGKSE